MEKKQKELIPVNCDWVSVYYDPNTEEFLAHITIDKKTKFFKEIK